MSPSALYEAGPEHLLESNPLHTFNTATRRIPPQWLGLVPLTTDWVVICSVAVLGRLAAPLMLLVWILWQTKLKFQALIYNTTLLNRKFPLCHNENNSDVLESQLYDCALTECIEWYMDSLKALSFEQGYLANLCNMCNQIQVCSQMREIITRVPSF